MAASGKPASEGAKSESPDSAAPTAYVKKERPPEPEPPGAPEWVVTFTDMISLLVTFFVLLMTFSSMEEHELLRVSSLLRGSPGLIEDYDSSQLVEPPNPDLLSDTNPVYGANSPHTRPAEAMPSDRSEQSTAIQPNKQAVDLNQLGDGLAIAWDRSASFAAGALDPNPRLVAALTDAAQVLLHYPHLIVVEGHSSAEFSPNAKFQDAEAESFERARRAAAHLVAAGIVPERIQLAGYGTSRPRNINQTSEARLENRRIELRILNLPKSHRDRLEAVRRASQTPDTGGE